MSEDSNSVTIVQSGPPYAQVVTIGRHTLSADEPPSTGGRDAGPSPYEFLLTGLGACSSITARMYADRHKWALRGIKVELRHEKITGPDGISIIDRFERAVHFDGDLTEDQKLRLFEIVEHCPVSRTLRNSAIVDSKLADAGVQVA